jgi:hypothetical protein
MAKAHLRAEYSWALLPRLLDPVLNCPRQLVLPFQLDHGVVASQAQRRVAGDFAWFDGAAAHLLPGVMVAGLGDSRRETGVEGRRSWPGPVARCTFPQHWGDSGGTRESTDE